MAVMSVSRLNTAGYPLRICAGYPAFPAPPGPQGLSYAETMKRIEPLIGLSREHHASLVLAKRCIETAQTGETSAINALCRSINEQFEATWEKHFREEEDRIFPAAVKCYPQLGALCQNLIDEHEQMRTYNKQMKQGNCLALEPFGELLRAHTRKEERQLFDVINKRLFSAQVARISST